MVRSKLRDLPDYSQPIACCSLDPCERSALILCWLRLARCCPGSPVPSPTDEAAMRTHFRTLPFAFSSRPNQRNSFGYVPGGLLHLSSRVQLIHAAEMKFAPCDIRYLLLRHTTCQSHTGHLAATCAAMCPKALARPSRPLPIKVPASFGDTSIFSATTGPERANFGAPAVFE